MMKYLCIIVSICIILVLVNRAIKEKFVANSTYTIPLPIYVKEENEPQSYEKWDTRRMFDSLTYDFNYLNNYT